MTNETMHSLMLEVGQRARKAARALARAQSSAKNQALMTLARKIRQQHAAVAAANALDLEKALSVRKRALIVGAGLIGLKCYEGIAERAGSVVIVDMADRVLSSVLDAEGAAVVQRISNRINTAQPYSP